MMINGNFQITVRWLAYLILFALALTGCASDNGVVKVGPKPSSEFETQATEAIAMRPKLDVVIPVFNPGLSESEENYEEEGVWPELRRAEANLSGNHAD